MTKTTQRLKMTDHDTDYLLKSPASSKAVSGHVPDIKTPSGPFSGSNLAFTMEPEDEIARLRAELKQVKREIAEVHDELWALILPQTSSISGTLSHTLRHLCTRLAAVVCWEEVGK